MIWNDRPRSESGFIDTFFDRKNMFVYVCCMLRKKHVSALVGWFENHDPSYHSFNPVKSLNGFLVASEAMQEALGAGPSEEQESAFKEPALVEPKKGKGKVPGKWERGGMVNGQKLRKKEFWRKDWRRNGLNYVYS